MERIRTRIFFNAKKTSSIGILDKKENIQEPRTRYPQGRKRKKQKPDQSTTISQQPPSTIIS